MSKPITLWSHAQGPNPWKVAIILEELGLKYESKFPEFSELKKPDYEKLNPNGRVPCIEDPNTGLVLWESGAIIQYLVEQYDPQHTLSFASSPEKHFAAQYLYFQASGQGPYFGQAAWFQHFHPEQIPSAQDRYLNEIKRVTKVLDGVLSKQEYLVGGKCSFADLSFVPWYVMVPFIDKEGKLALEEECPSYAAWMGKLLARPAVKKVLKDREEVLKNSSH